MKTRGAAPRVDPQVELERLRTEGCTDHSGQMHQGTVLMRDGSLICARAYNARLRAQPGRRRGAAVSA